jgi:hypothetical protein
MSICINAGIKVKIEKLSMAERFAALSEALLVTRRAKK